jgi:hypothetical protein
MPHRRLIFRDHALHRMHERRTTPDELHQVLSDEAIEVAQVLLNSARRDQHMST